MTLGSLSALEALSPQASHASGLSNAASVAISMVGVVALLAAIITVQYLAGRPKDTRLHGGLTSGRRRAIRQQGQRAQAKVIVLNSVKVGSDSTYDMVLEVSSPPQSPYRIQVVESFDEVPTINCSRGMVCGEPSVGATINVFVDRSDPKVVVVDIDDLVRRRDQEYKRREQDKGEAELQTQRQAAEERDRALRGG